ncbi:MAG: hypothetical protein AAGH90_03430 [Pseudomonadota bacterium]
MRVLFCGMSALALLGACGVPAPVPTPAPQTGPSQEQIDELTERLQEIREREALCLSRSIEVPTKLQTETFGALTDLVGARLRGTPSDGSTERAPDIQQWEWALGGTAILIRHALEDRSYGGDTYVYKDAARGELVYVYVTNAGFRTEGVILLNDNGSYTAEEDVAGHPTITKVRSTSVINRDGSTSMTSEYLDGGDWVPGHAFNYMPTDEPLPRLKPKSAEVEAP